MSPEVPATMGRDEAPHATPDMTPDIGPVLLVGAGLVGASIGLALSRAGVRVHLRDRAPSHALVAAGLGAGVVDAPDAESVRLVVVAVPPDAAPAVIRRQLAAHPNAVVTDVASVKQRVRDRVEGPGVDAARYVGSHPMAGSHRTGPLTATADLFVDRTWVVTTEPRNPEWAVERVRALARVCGARLVEMDATEHDEAVAQVSHLPQLMSSLTAGHLRQVPASHLNLAGQGIRDVTRIAASDPVLWRQIVTANAEAIRRQLVGVRDDLDALLAGLDDPETLEGFIARGREGVRSLPGKHGRQSRDYDHVVVEIPDTPGALARLFADVDAEGVNVEDLAIEHDDAREVGFLSIAVSPESAMALAAGMTGRGWTLRP